MAPQTTSLSLLRAASFRIASASKPELPHVAACVAQALLSCKDILSNSDLAAQKDSDAAIVLHRFNTQITSLLQDRTVEGRWAAIVLVKATVEAGAWESLRKSNTWVRGLITMLKKPDPPLTRCLCIIALTRIFMLTWDYPTLIREITTPSLPTFVSTCLSNISARGNAPQELKTTLESFAQLIPRHPTIFRLHQSTIAKVLQSVFDDQSSSDHMIDLASRISVLLHQCEPKGGASEKWETSLIATVQTAHAMADRTLISIDEDWQSVTASNLVNKQVLSESYSKSQAARNPSDRPVSQFVTTGYRGLINHLRLISAYYAGNTSGPVNSVFGSVTDLITRLMAVTISQTTSRSTVRFRQDVSREERDELTGVLPQIHVACMEIVSVMLDRYGSAMTSALPPFLDQMLWVFSSSIDVNVRAAAYVVGEKIVELTGQSFNKQTVGGLRRYITACCDDLLPSELDEKKQQTTNGTGGKVQSAFNADAFLKQGSTISATPTQLPGLKSAAWNLLPNLLGKLPAENIPVAVRTLMDRAAVLTCHKDAILASTLNQVTSSAGRKSNSLLPLLARQYPTDAGTETLLRPRMPVIQIGRPRHPSDSDMEDAPDDDSSSSSSSEEEEEISEVEESRNRVTALMRPSNSPDEPSIGTAAEKDTAHAEQDLVNWALKNYNSGNTEAEVSVEEKKMIGKALYGDEAARLPEEEARDERAGKRQRVPSPVLPEKRRRSSPVVEGAVAATGGDAAGGDADSDDDEFVVPPIVLGDDSDDDDDEEEEKEE